MSLPRTTLGNNFDTRRSEASGPRVRFFSDQIYTWEESNAFFMFHHSYFISKRRILSELLRFAFIIEGERRGERGEEGGNSLHINHMFFLSIIVQKCAPYTQIKFVPGVRFLRHELRRRRRRTFTAFFAEDVHRRSMVLALFYFFFQFFVKM